MSKELDISQLEKDSMVVRMQLEHERPMERRALDNIVQNIPYLVERLETGDVVGDFDKKGCVEFILDQNGFLLEASRVLRSAGKLILIVPHRGGLWSRAETTPFGHGTPFSKRQIFALSLIHI